MGDQDEEDEEGDPPTDRQLAEIINMVSDMDFVDSQNKLRGILSELASELGAGESDSFAQEGGEDAVPAGGGHASFDLEASLLSDDNEDEGGRIAGASAAPGLQVERSETFVQRVLEYSSNNPTPGVLVQRALHLQRASSIFQQTSEQLQDLAELAEKANDESSYPPRPSSSSSGLVPPSVPVSSSPLEEDVAAHICAAIENEDRKDPRILVVYWGRDRLTYSHRTGFRHFRPVPDQCRISGMSGMQSISQSCPLPIHSPCQHAQSCRMHRIVMSDAQYHFGRCTS